jgi:hypothetical protein
VCLCLLQLFYLALCGGRLLMSCRCKSMLAQPEQTHEMDVYAPAIPYLTYAAAVAAGHKFYLKT